jgi:hypothetical protein
MRNVKERTTFDMGCDDAKLVQLGDIAWLGTLMTRTNIGATCGDKRSSYTVTCVSNWGTLSCTPEINSKAD